MKGINDKKQQKLDALHDELDFTLLFTRYAWKRDTWDAGFPDILRLELEMTRAAQNGQIGRGNLVRIAEWGGLPGKSRIRCLDPLKISLYDDDDQPVQYLHDEPNHAVSIIQSQVSGYGPTYISKLLRFASPGSFGAIDTRLVRVFGDGDPDVHKIRLLNLTVTQIEGRWAISKTQRGWPTEYGTWVMSLRYLAEELNRTGTYCPHPVQFVATGLRDHDNSWTPADVEMALFAYASQRIRRH
jgi:hypothetical protein